MRTETITKTLYKFDELSDDAKETARDWWRNADAIDSSFSECVIEDAARMADILGIDLRQRPVKLMNGSTRYDPTIYFSGFSSQGDGACFEGSYRYKLGSVKAIKSEAPQDTTLHAIARDLQNIQRKAFYKLHATIKQHGRYYAMDIDVYRGDDQYRDISSELEDGIKEALKDFANWIYRQLKQEYDYQNSDENVDESIRINEYEFTENGDIA